MLYRTVFKRVFDILLSGAALIALAPLLLLIAAAIRIEDGGRIIFRQQRVGRGGVPFLLLKFRSMPENTPHVSSDAARNLRITRIGRLLRRTNLDELPQLMNILRGEMSVVGPRPALMTQHELIALREQSGAVACVPGLTGLAQVNATDGMPVAEKARWDAAYAQRISLLGDIRIVMRTFRYLMSPPPTY